jgi:hypothetical protein
VSCHCGKSGDAITQMATLVSAMAKQLADLNMQISNQHERLDAHGVWLERLNKECRHLMRYTKLPNEET